jgi:hypothetical protein
MSRRTRIQMVGKLADREVEAQLHELAKLRRQLRRSFRTSTTYACVDYQAAREHVRPMFGILPTEPAVASP